MGVDSAEIVVLMLGGLLLLTAIVGGGFEIKEAKIPKIGGGARALAGIFGVVLILFGINMLYVKEPDYKNQGVTNRSPDTNSDAVTFTIKDDLGASQVSEQVRIIIDGRVVGDLTVTEYFPSAKIEVAVPRPGSHSYALQATAVFRDNEGNQFEYNGAGQGNIDVSSGKHFQLASTISGNTWLAHLEDIAER